MALLAENTGVAPTGRGLAHLSDEAVLSLVASADDEALAELYDRFGGVAYGLALRILRDEALAQDAVQEAFLAVWRTADRFLAERARASTWILTLVHRRAVDLVRREDRRRAEPLADESEVPALDVWETENEIVYALDLPGIPEDDISIEFEDGSLTVTAERERKQEVSDDKLYRFERRFGTYSRTFGLPQGVTEDDIKAEYRDGVLEVHVSKPEQVKRRRIQIGSGEKKTIEGKAERA